AGLRIARAFAQNYLALANYTNNLRRMGWSDEDLGGEGSERLIDAVIAIGDVDAIVRRVRDHLDAGADHVCVQIREAQSTDPALGQLRAGRVHIVNGDRELDAGAGRGRGDRHWLDELVRRVRLEQIDQRVPEVEHGRRVILEVDGQAEDFLVEPLGLGQILG